MQTNPYQTTPLQAGPARPAGPLAANAGMEAARAKARETAEQFESFFLAQVMQSMFHGLKTDGPFGGGHGEQVFRSILIDEFGKTMSTGGGIGIADAVYRELIKLQEG